MIDVTVIGAGPAGCSAAVQCRRLGLEVKLLDKTGQAGGLTAEAWKIENYPGVEKPLTGVEFTHRLQEFVSGFGLQVFKFDVNSIEKSKPGFLLISNRDDIKSRSVIIATGTNPNRIDLPCVYYSVQEILGAAPERVTVIGGGEASFDYALSLADSNCKVNLCIRGESPGFTGKLIEYVNSRSSITVSYNTRVDSVKHTDSGYDVILRDAEGARTVSTDKVLAAIGRRPALPDLGNIELISGSIITSFPGLFVCGDACRGTLGQIGIAVGQGIETAGLIIEYLRDNE